MSRTTVVRRRHNGTLPRPSKGPYPYHEGKHLLVMVDALYLYADESGTEPNETFCIMAGYVGSPRQWTAFNSEWWKVIATGQMPTFHGTTYFDRARRSRLVSPPDPYLDGLLKTIEAYDIEPIGAAVKWSVFKSLPDDVRDLLATDDQRHPYYLAMWQLVGLVCNGFSGTSREQAEINFVFGWARQHSGHILNTFTEVVENAVAQGVIEAEIIGQPGFGKPSKRPELQAADLLCHTWFRMLSGDRSPLIVTAFERATKGTTNLQVLDLAWVQAHIGELGGA